MCLDNITSDAREKQIEPGTPAYLIKMRRKRVTDSKPRKNEMEVDLTNCESSGGEMESAELTINGQNVYKSDLQLLKSDHEWLNKCLINAGQ